MHIEKNVFKNLFNTIMDVKGKSKDYGVKCRKDIALYCRRPELELKLVRHGMVVKKAKYQLTTQQQILVLNWIETLKFPDGFSANLGRHDDYNDQILVAYKTLDAHVFWRDLWPLRLRDFFRIQFGKLCRSCAHFFAIFAHLRFILKG
ncbi:unnamed protein product [Rhodiola kirilowii]